MSDEEKKAIERLKDLISKSKVIGDIEINKQVVFKDIETILNLIEKQSKEIERINEILIWKQKHEEQLQKEIERLNNKFEKIYNEIDNKNSQLVKALNYKLFMEDKIKAKIEELEKLDFGTDLVSQFTANLTTITILQSLLNEEE